MILVDLEQNQAENVEVEAVSRFDQSAYDELLNEYDQMRTQAVDMLTKIEFMKKKKQEALIKNQRLIEMLNQLVRVKSPQKSLLNSQFRLKNQKIVESNFLGIL